MPCLLGAQRGVFIAFSESCRAIKVDFIVIRIGTDNGFPHLAGCLCILSLARVLREGKQSELGGKAEKRNKRVED